MSYDSLLWTSSWPSHHLTVFTHPKTCGKHVSPRLRLLSLPSPRGASSLPCRSYRMAQTLREGWDGQLGTGAGWQKLGYAYPAFHKCRVEPRYPPTRLLKASCHHGCQGYVQRFRLSPGPLAAYITPSRPWSYRSGPLCACQVRWILWTFRRLDRRPMSVQNAEALTLQHGSCFWCLIERQVKLDSHIRAKQNSSRK